MFIDNWFLMVNGGTWHRVFYWPLHVALAAAAAACGRSLVLQRHPAGYYMIRRRCQ
jgi:hypothetical protein